MKEGMALESVAAELSRQRQVKKDYRVSSGAMRFVKDEDGAGLTFDIGGKSQEFELNRFSHGQLASYLKIPRDYYDRCLAEPNGLLGEHVNHWLKKSAGNRRLVRTLDGKVRALLGPSYRMLDTYDLFEAAVPSILKADCRIESCNLTDTKLYIKAVSNVLRAEVPKVGDIVEASVTISGSDVGAGSIEVLPGIFTLRCTNGMTCNDSRLRKVHLGRRDREDENKEFYKDDTLLAQDVAFWKQVRDVVEHSFDDVFFNKMVNRLEASVGDKIEGDVVAAIEAATEVLSLSVAEGEGVIKHLIEGGQLNRYGLINAITRHSQDIDDYDRASEMERIGGRVLELPQRDWEKISLAKN